MLKQPMILSVAALLVAGCAVGPNYVKPDVATEQRFETQGAPVYSSEASQGDFWAQFGDPILSGLVTDALQANHDLRIAAARFSEARAARGEAKFDLAPTITASGAYTEQLYPQPTRALVPGGNVKLYDAGFDAVWELDFFGRIRRSIEAATAEAQSAGANLRNTQIVVAAEVARAYFELRGEQAQLAVLQRNVANQQEAFDLTNSRLQAGRGTELDTSRAQAVLSDTLATISPLEAEIARSIHGLSVLTGREPTALTAQLSLPGALPPLPAVVAVGNPADLLRRRPDILASERALAAATARIGVATADLFPKVTFTGSIGVGASTFSGLGDQGSGTRLVAPGISWAAFDLGRVREEIVGAKARNEAALAGYEQTVLRALQETEDALVTHARSREALKHAADSAGASEIAARLARIRFDGGMIDFLQVLDAERTQLDAQNRLAQSRTATATSLVALYKALGGGWQSSFASNGAVQSAPVALSR